MGLLRAASSISALTLVSRVLGLARDVLMYHVIGANWASGSFVLAWMVPNLLRRLFGEGALSAAFIPAFTQTRKRDGDAAARGLLAGVSGALAALLLAIVGLVLVASWLLPPEVWGLDGGSAVSERERGALIWELLRILFPYVLPVCLLAIYAGALNALGVFAPTAAAPALLNMFWIGGLLVAQKRAAEDPAAAVLVVSWSVILGGTAQILLGILPLRRRGMFAAPALPRPGDGTREVFVRMAPAALGLSIAQLNLLVDQALAEFLVGPGSNNYVYLANRLLLFPHALVAIPLATAVFPTLAARADDRPASRRELGRATRYTLLLTLPAAAGMVWIADDLIGTVFVHGRFTGDDAALATATTATLVAGLPAIGVTQLYSRALFALGDTRTPARIAAALVLANLGLNLVFVLGLGLGVAGLTLATTCCSYANVWLLHDALARRDARGEVGGRQLARLLAAVAVMVALIAAVELVLPLPAGRGGRLAVGVGVPIAVGVGAYAAAAHLLGVEEIRTLWLRLRAAVTRRGRTP